MTVFHVFGYMVHETFTETLTYADIPHAVEQPLTTNKQYSILVIGRQTQNQAQLYICCY